MRNRILFPNDCLLDEQHQERILEALAWAPNIVISGSEPKGVPTAYPNLVVGSNRNTYRGMSLNPIKDFGQYVVMVDGDEHISMNKGYFRMTGNHWMISKIPTRDPPSLHIWIPREVKKTGMRHYEFDLGIDQESIKFFGFNNS